MFFTIVWSDSYKKTLFYKFGELLSAIILAIILQVLSHFLDVWNNGIPLDETLPDITEEFYQGAIRILFSSINVVKHAGKKVSRAEALLLIQMVANSICVIISWYVQTFLQAIVSLYFGPTTYWFITNFGATLHMIMFEFGIILIDAIFLQGKREKSKKKKGSQSVSAVSNTVSTKISNFSKTSKISRK
ncbi:unnamed protein product, partial [Mesorhabditis belari]|uniref:Uncharacterized protein n=1 Tax=Mesorhabditis belari TaxID=2138241 RepID=A0AAF3J8W2_9BILA